MTKKFWNDWQKRIGETKDIQLFWIHPQGLKERKEKLHWVLNKEDRLIKATFHGDTVDLVIERHCMIFNYNTWSLKQHIENEYKTLHREEIACIEFKK